MPEVNVKQSSDELDTYDDILRQKVTRQVRIDTSDISNDFGGMGADPTEALDFEVIGEDFWNQVPADVEVIGELVRVDVIDDYFSLDESSESDTGMFRGDTNFGIQPGRGGTTIRKYDNEKRDIGDANNNMTVNGEAMENHRYIYDNHHVVQPVLSDKTNGTGGGGTPHSTLPYPFTLNFRQEFGRGPLVTEADQLTFNANYQLFGTLNATVAHGSNVHLYWDIYERDVGSLKDTLRGSI